MNADTKTLEQRALLQPKLENIISGYRINSDDADWLRGLLHQPALSNAAEAKGVEYDRHIVAGMLDALRKARNGDLSAAKGWHPNAIEQQQRLLRAADEADAEGVGTVCRKDIVAAISDAIADVRPPDKLTETKAEYWKAGARAVINVVNRALASAPSPETEGDDD